MPALSAEGWTSDLLSVNGTRIHYTRVGGGRQRLIALHGRTGNGLTWTCLARRLAPRYDVIMPDLRGHGQSGAPTTGWDIATMADDILGLANALGLPRFVLMGIEERDWTDTIEFCRREAPLSVPALVPDGHTTMYDNSDTYADPVLTFLTL